MSRLQSDELPSDTSYTAAEPCAFVFGASGYTGQALVREMLGRGIRVVAHFRRSSSRLATVGAALKSLGAELSETTWDEEEIRETLVHHQPTHVFGCLGITKRGARAEAKRTGAAIDYERIDFGLTKVAIDACVALPNAPMFIYLSSLGVREGAMGAYLQARWKAESHLQRSGLPYRIVRPCFITGGDRDESRPMERVSAAIADGALSLLGGLGLSRVRDRFHSITGAQLAFAMTELSLSPEYSEGVYEAETLQALLTPSE